MPYSHIILNTLLIICQATVLAVGIFSDDPHLYSVRPFGISGTCKREDVPSQKQLLESACEALSQKASDIGGHLYSLASDGDSRRRRATVMLTMNSKLAPDSKLQALLGDLELLNCLCGLDDETADFEYKQLLKRLRNTLLWLK